jgi:hypothetical protein
MSSSRAKPVEKNVKLEEDAMPWVAPPLAKVGEKRSYEPDYVNFDYELEKKKIEIREKNLVLFKQEEQAKHDVAMKQVEVDKKQDEIRHRKQYDDWLYPRKK